jgi:hypothetical protein
MSAFILFALSVIVVVELCAAKTTRGELIINGDAETGDISGWVDGGIEVVSNAAAGTLGLPLGVDIGDFRLQVPSALPWKHFRNRLT